MVCVSHSLAEEVVRMGVLPEPVLIQHNGVDGERFAPRDRAEARARLGLPISRRLLLYIGKLDAEKGPDVLVDALARLRPPESRAAEAVFIGGGPLEGRTSARARELGIEGRVRFVGRKLHPEVPDWMAAADLLCLPSRREGCPNVVLEALTSGRPVVAASVGGVPELPDGRNGLLVPGEDSAALAAGVDAALARAWDPKALRETVPYLSWDGYARALHATLAEVLEGYRRTRGAPVAGRECDTLAAPLGVRRT